MTDKERREDEALTKCIQEAYGCSDDELLAEFEEIEATLSDSDFPGIEERVYQKLMARIAEDEAAEAEKSADVMEPEVGEVKVVAEVGTETEVKSENVAEVESVIELVPPVSGEKVVRFSRKKVLLVGVLAAAFVGVLGGTAIGGRSYFFKLKEGEKGIIFDNSEYLKVDIDLNDAYEEAEKFLNIPIMKLGYIPKNLKFVDLHLSEDNVIFYFQMGEKSVYFCQERQNKNTSLGINSDREKTENKIFNEWLQKDIYLEQECYENGECGYSAVVYIENRIYRVIGQIGEEEMKKIAQNLNLY